MSGAEDPPGSPTPAGDGEPGRDDPPPPTANTPPVVADIQGVEQVRAGDFALHRADISDPDGDELQVRWSLDGAELPEGRAGDEIRWQAPLTVGPHTLQIEVADGGGATVSKSLQIEVTRRDFGLSGQSIGAYAEWADLQGWTDTNNGVITTLIGGLIGVGEEQERVHAAVISVGAPCPADPQRYATRADYAGVQQLLADNPDKQIGRIAWSHDRWSVVLETPGGCAEPTELVRVVDHDALQATAESRWTAGSQLEAYEQDPADDSFVALFRKFSPSHLPPTSQALLTTADWDEAHAGIEQRWPRGLVIVHASQSAGRFHIVLRAGQHTGIRQRIRWSADALPMQDIQQGWSEGLQITNLIHDHGRWGVVLSG